MNIEKRVIVTTDKCPLAPIENLLIALWMLKQLKSVSRVVYMRMKTRH